MRMQPNGNSMFHRLVSYFRPLTEVPFSTTSCVRVLMQPEDANMHTFRIFRVPTVDACEKVRGVGVFFLIIQGFSPPLGHTRACFLSLICFVFLVCVYQAKLLAVMHFAAHDAQTTEAGHSPGCRGCVPAWLVYQSGGLQPLSHSQVQSGSRSDSGLVTPSMSAPVSLRPAGPIIRTEEARRPSPSAESAARRNKR